MEAGIGSRMPTCGTHVLHTYAASWQQGCASLHSCQAQSFQRSTQPAINFLCREINKINESRAFSPSLPSTSGHAGRLRAPRGTSHTHTHTHSPKSRGASAHRPGARAQSWHAGGSRAELRPGAANPTRPARSAQAPPDGSLPGRKRGASSAGTARPSSRRPAPGPPPRQAARPRSAVLTLAASRDPHHRTAPRSWRGPGGPARPCPPLGVTRGARPAPGRRLVGFWVTRSNEN